MNNHSPTLLPLYLFLCSLLASTTAVPNPYSKIQWWNLSSMISSDSYSPLHSLPLDLRIISNGRVIFDFPFYDTLSNTRLSANKDSSTSFISPVDTLYYIHDIKLSPSQKMITSPDIVEWIILTPKSFSIAPTTPIQSQSQWHIP